MPGIERQYFCCRVADFPFLPGGDHHGADFQLDAGIFQGAADRLAGELVPQTIRLPVERQLVGPV